jgi:hypothetical protein
MRALVLSSPWLNLDFGRQEHSFAGLSHTASEPNRTFLLLLYDDFGLVKCRRQSWNLLAEKATEKARLLEAAKSLGFEVVVSENCPARLGLDRVATKRGHTLDTFW